ncbi:MAG: hypothetical protein ABL308_08595 [Oceanicaulis sp.]
MAFDIITIAGFIAAVYAAIGWWARWHYKMAAAPDNDLSRRLEGVPIDFANGGALGVFVIAAYLLFMGRSAEFATLAGRESLAFLSAFVWATFMILASSWRSWNENNPG